MKLQSENKNTVRLCGTVTAELYDIFSNDAQKQMRTDSAMLNVILRKYYAEQLDKKKPSRRKVSENY